MPALSFSLNTHVFNELVSVAEETGMSRSNLANKALEEYLPKVKFMQGLEQSYQEFQREQVVVKTIEELESMVNE